MVADCCWPTGGTAIIEINVTLPTFKCRSERPVSMRHFGKLAARDITLLLPVSGSFVGAADAFAGMEAELRSE